MNLRVATDPIELDGSAPGALGSAATERTEGHAARRPIGIAASGHEGRGLLAGKAHHEAHLIFQLARGEDGAGGGASEPLGPATDWTLLLQIAWEEGAVGVLRNHCRQLPPGTVPSEIDRRLACLALDREFRMRVLERRTRESVSVLADAGIDVALLKGAGLAATLYGSFAARSMKDVDLLVPRSRAEVAKRLMMSTGWESDRQLPDDDVYRVHHHLAPLVDSRGSRSRLEIHRTLLPSGHPFALSMGELWDAMRVTDFGGRSVYVLDSTHHALHIAIHFAWSHMLRAGAWHAFRDLGTLDRAGLIDWDALVVAARRARAGSCCYWTLALARRMASLPVPDAVLRALAPAGGDAALRRLERHFVNVLLRRDATQELLRVDRALWSIAIQPRQQGHGVVRPWVVSLELTAARLPNDRSSRGARALRRVGRAARGSAYIARLLWS